MLSLFKKTYFGLLLAVISCAQTSENPEASVAVLKQTPLEELKTAIMELDADSAMRYGHLGISIRSVRTGEILLEQNARKAMVIASNLKLVTTLTALEMLGDDFRFQTTLEYDGTLQEDGTLNGNLYIRGGGDPTLGSDRVTGSLELDALMALWAQKIQAAGIRRIKGNVVADDEIFNENVLPNGWTWGDIGNYYGAAAFGLSINDNLYKVYLETGKKTGDPTRLVRTEPAMQDIIFVNEVTTGPAGSGDQSYIYGAPYTYHRVMQGTVPMGRSVFVVRGSLPDPPLFAAQQLRNTLQRKGITVSESATSTRLLKQQKRNNAVTPTRKVVYTHFSPALAAIVEQTNLRSMNLYAEAMLKMMGVKQLNKSTTWESTDAVKDFWQQKGMDMTGFFMRDGSGLSRSNALPPDFLSNLLVFATKQPYFNQFYKSLPVAGVSGTMKSIGEGTAATGNLRAKTGTLDRMSSYSGYFKTQSGELMAFALVANDYAGKEKDFRRKAEKILVRLPSLP
jgi:D-alanyl-D-alanine carboxypeptidase/D-alanyl-D-alanine-endopeptidase (penicillin-binding protein 4)